MAETVRPPIYASSPYEGKILAYYGQYFSCVYVALHPFIKPNKILFSHFIADKWPSKSEILTDCEAITWKKIIDSIRFKDISQLDVALRTSIGGLSAVVAKPNDADVLIEFIEGSSIVPPEEGQIPPHLENRLLESLRKLGHTKLLVGDEFGFQSNLHSISELLEEDLLPACGCYCTEEHDFLAISHWDSHCTFLCGSEADLNLILASEQYEGFWCSPETEVLWGLYPI